MTAIQEPDEEDPGLSWMYDESSFDPEDQPSIMPWLVPLVIIVGFFAIFTVLVLLFL
jgi:hypothetical protein